MAEYFSEALVSAHRQQLLISEIVYRESSSTQEILIFRNPLFGTVMALDNVVQTTTGDEFIYHEMLTHVPILAHGNASRALIIGGGDGGILRHVLKHKKIERAVMVEIEPRVIDLTKQYIPEICGDAFDDPRAKVIIDDGCKYVRETEERFDVVIVDSTDPDGPARVLYAGILCRLQTLPHAGRCHRHPKRCAFFSAGHHTEFEEKPRILFCRCRVLSGDDTDLYLGPDGARFRDRQSGATANRH